MKKMFIGLALLLSACSSSPNLNDSDKEAINRIILKTCQKAQARYTEEMKKKYEDEDFKEMVDDLKTLNPCEKVKL